MKQNLECPYCDGLASLQRERKEIPYRKEVFTIVAHFYKCEKCGEEFTSTESDSISLTQVHNLYREKNNIPFPEEIAAIREKYKLSATKMSEVLGLGANGYSNYENGEIPTPAYGNLISAAADATTFLRLLDKAKEHFSEKAFAATRENVQQLQHKEAIEKDILDTLNVVNEPNNFTGYKKTSAKKITHLISYFIHTSKPEYNDKLKINKQLFYTDFAHFKQHGTSITGLSYRAITYGPVPAKYDNIFVYLENTQKLSSTFIKLNNKGAREMFMANEACDTSVFTAEELATIESIGKQFAHTASWDLVELSHQEKAWKELAATKSLIGYQDYAFDLKAV